jgi:hypothetical protein
MQKPSSLLLYDMCFCAAKFLPPTSSSLQRMDPRIPRSTRKKRADLASDFAFDATLTLAVIRETVTLALLDGLIDGFLVVVDASVSVV